MKLIISYSGLDDASKGTYMGKIISWLITMRTAFWITWNANPMGTVFSKCLDDRDITSVCDISGLRISGLQFFRCE